MASLGENVLFSDADGSTDFGDALGKFEEIISSGKGDALICGSRCHLRNESDSVVKVIHGFLAYILFINIGTFRDPSSDYFL